MKRFIKKLLIYFLPNPGSAPEGTAIVTGIGTRKVFHRLFIFLLLGCQLAVLFDFITNTDILKSIPIFAVRSDLYGRDYIIVEMILMALAAIYYALMPILRYKYSWLRVTGVIYAFCVGYLYSFSINNSIKHYVFIIACSLVISAVLVLIPLFLLVYKNIKPPKKMARITYIAFAVMTLGGSVVKILNQIPFICILTGHFIDLSKFIGFRVFVDAINVIIAFLFISLSFDRIRDYIRRGVSRKYEWLGAFTGFYTVTIIIGKIGEILLLIMPN